MEAEKEEYFQLMIYNVNGKLILNQIIFNDQEIQHDDFCFQNQTIGKNHVQTNPNLRYKARYTAYTSINAGHLVSPKTDPGDYIIEKSGDIVLQAGGYISLKSGFEVQAGGTLHAFIGIENCSRPRTAEFFPSESNLDENDDNLPAQDITENGTQSIARNDEIQLRIYPNPSTGVINYEVDDNSVGYEYRIHSYHGKLVEEGIIQRKNAQLRIELSKGIYYFSIQGMNEIKTEKIIIL